MVDIQEKAINTLRFLSADGVQKANSGHPGLPMGTAAIAYTIWTRHLKFNPQNPNWWDRDRFVLSGGHGSMLLYSLLHLTGFALSMEELKNFRQWGSLTPGHPEFGLTPGVEATTGPLGQGFANGVGMAIAEAHLAGEFNLEGYKPIDHFVYGIVTDGDLMEGVASEAASFAGHLKLGKIIYCYDDNRITIDGSTDLAFTEDRAERFRAYGWQVLSVKDGNDVEGIDQAIQQAKKDPRPSLVICRTHIGYGLPTRQDTSKAHGEPPGVEELAKAKENLEWPAEPAFYIPDDVKEHFLNIKKQGSQMDQEWQNNCAKYASTFPEKWKELERRFTGNLPEGWEQELPVFEKDEKGAATRMTSGLMINALAGRLPELMGGSADLTPSNNTWIKESRAIQPGDFSGRYIHFGVREHGMGAVVNGLAYHGGVLPFGATFLVFTDYMRGALRVSALSHLHAIWVMTHDSIGLGEDGPTHQPVEHLAALRAIPNLMVIRPGDANEVREAWIRAIKHKGPVLLALTRQALPVIDRTIFSSAKGLQKGAYVLKDFGQGTPELILMASGSEVHLILQAAEHLSTEGHQIRVVSFPSWELFEKQSTEYRESVLPDSVRLRVAVEAGIEQGWHKWVGLDGVVVGMKGFGASAPYTKLMKEYGFSYENVYKEAKELLERKK